MRRMRRSRADSGTNQPLMREGGPASEALGSAGRTFSPQSPLGDPLLRPARGQCIALTQALGLGPGEQVVHVLDILERLVALGRDAPMQSTASGTGSALPEPTANASTACHSYTTTSLATHIEVVNKSPEPARTHPLTAAITASACPGLLPEPTSARTPTAVPYSCPLLPQRIDPACHLRDLR